MDVAELLERHGTTYADQAGITLRDKPMPLFQLLVLTQLSSARISADIAAASAREVFRAGWRTPRRLRQATWQERVDALGRGGYRRYDESTATALGGLADQVLEDLRGDLRRIRPGDAGAAELEDRLTGFPRIGPQGARIFCREVQDTWPEVAPYLDDGCRDAAGRLGLPRDPHRLADRAPGGRVAVLAAALTRYALQNRRQ
ncbi:MAG: endonuclease [Marmoricola sp.]